MLGQVTDGGYKTGNVTVCNAEGETKDQAGEWVQVRYGPAQSGPTLSGPAQSGPAQSGSVTVGPLNNLAY